MKRLIFVSASLVLTSAAFSATTDTTLPSFDHGSSIIAGGGLSIPMLGSWERRAGGLLGYSTWRPEPKLSHMFGAHTDAVWTYYGMYHSGRDGRYQSDPSWAGGFTFGYRKSWVRDDGRGLAYQLYWGGVYADTASRDLPSEINSTPGMVFSWLRPLGTRNLNANLQYMHQSNGGLVQRNRGENFFLFTLEFKLH